MGCLPTPVVTHMGPNVGICHSTFVGNMYGDNVYLHTSYFFIFVFFVFFSGEPVCYEEILARFVYYSSSVMVYSEEDSL